VRRFPQNIEAILRLRSFFLGETPLPARRDNGFIVGGTEPAKILLRAIGPSLAAFGVPNTLAATTLDLHDSNGGAISNDGWRSTQEADIKATTIPPTNDNESAVVATLARGNYTGVVRGKNDTTGIAVVEAYNLQ
jgi:hypothetical protein